MEMNWSVSAENTFEFKARNTKKTEGTDTLVSVREMKAAYVSSEAFNYQLIYYQLPSQSIN